VPGGGRRLATRHAWDTVGHFLCSKCDAGQYQREEAQGTCAICNDAIGEYQNKTGQAECNECDPGKFSPGIESGCKECPIGYQKLCGAGDQSCANDCQACVAGKYQKNQGQKECEKCGAGSYQDEQGKNRLNQDECKSCSLGQYQDIDGKTTCITGCKGPDGKPDGKIPNADKTGCIVPSYDTAFKCKKGFYLWDQSNNTEDHECRLCPPGARCDTKEPVPTLHELTAINGYMNFSWAKAEEPFAKCPYPDACVNGSCVIGNEGVLCAICTPTYVRGVLKCDACTPENVGTKVAVTTSLVICLLILAVLWQTKCKKCRKKCKFIRL
jgi:hypothetical protein